MNDVSAPGLAPPDMQAMLQNLAAQNPTMAMIAQMLQARQQTATVDAASPDEDLARDNDALRETLEQQQRRADKLERIARRLAADLQHAHDRLADLAAAVGACGLCWGEDARCPSCRGRGKPGRFAADAELRQALMQPPPPG